MNSIFLHDTVTLMRVIGDDETFVTGKVTGLVTHDETGSIKYLTIKGIEQPIWMTEGWKFVEDYEGDEDDA